MEIIRHPKLAEDIRDAAMHDAEISERVLAAYWSELDEVLASVKRNPRSHRYDSCGLRRANLRKFPYYMLGVVDDDALYLAVLSHDKRHPDYGMDRRPA